MSDSSDKVPAEGLATPVQFLNGVGPQRADLLRRLSLQTARDVLFCFPRDYQDTSDLRPVAQLEEDKLLSVRGVVEELDLRNTSSGGSMLGVLIRDGEHFLRALWFNQPHMKKRLPTGTDVLLSGQAKLRGGRWEMTHPRVQIIAEDEETSAESMLPVYPLTEGLKQYHMRRIVRHVVEEHAAQLDEVFPPDFLAKHDLIGIHEAVTQIHLPRDAESLERARRRFVFQELLVLQLALAERRREQSTTARAVPLKTSAQVDARILRRFPFELTGSQKQAIEEIKVDLARETPMNRLLQGDVGSGKTVVALYAILAALAHGTQAVLMAPTEVLARQHARTFGKFLEASRVRTALLTGTLKAAQRRETLEQIASGEVDVVIGTQAIIQSDVTFANLALAVIDEQHKFGVHQRAGLRAAGRAPHYLVMTATPIPRTVAMTVFGDLDISTLRDTPPGRQTVHTYVGTEEQRAKWWDFFRKKLREGRQGYVIAPLVESSEDLSQPASVETLFEELANGELEAFRMGLVHGRMNATEKDAAMQDFSAGKIQVLAATSVVEVGIDVPNATLMTIESAQQFGLAQLHQLRGRISRGSQPGYCCAFAQTTTDEAAQRLAAFAESTDGFHLAEVDFQLRGPGDLLGTAQHGLPPLRIADLTRDAEVLKEVRQQAREMVDQTEGLSDPKWARLRKMVSIRYGRVLELGDVG
jgi:ATP-dependent DNA helicase RecG